MSWVRTRLTLRASTPAISRSVGARVARNTDRARGPGWRNTARNSSDWPWTRKHWRGEGAARGGRLNKEATAALYELIDDDECHRAMTPVNHPRDSRGDVSSFLVQGSGHSPPSS